MTQPALTAVDFDPFAGPELLRTAPSTEPQREIWTAVQMGEEASLSFNESVSVSLTGPLDTASLQRATDEVVARHESLRATFSPDGLTLCLGAAGPVLLSRVDLRALDPARRDTQLRGVQSREVETPFSLEQGPLFRATLVSLADTEHVLVLTAHHIVFDGWSMAVVVRELGALYTAHRQGAAPTLPTAPSFCDYARGLQRATSADDERYWLDQFRGSLPVLDLPLDRVRPASKTYASIRIDHALPAPLIADLKKLGAKSGASFFTTLLAAFEALLFRLSGQEDLVVGIPAAGQSTAGLDNLVGHCVNTLPLRTFVDGRLGFDALLKSVRKSMLDGYEHQGFTYGSLLQKLAISRDPSRLPLVSVLFNVDQSVSAAGSAFEGLTARVGTNPRHFENFEIFINATETRGEVVLECQFNADLFDAGTLRRWLAAFEVLVESVCRSPSAALADLPIVPEAERALVLAWNDTKRPYPKDVCAHTLIEAQAARTPDSIALVSGTSHVTYRDLDERANALAVRLRAQGCTAGTLVGLCVERSVGMVVGLLGILKAGGAYVPLDPAFPKDRLQFMVEDAQMPLLVTQEKLAAALALPVPDLVFIDETGATISTTAPSTDALTTTSHAENPAYVIYTSGSTGRPKGVSVPHRAVVNFLLSMKEAPGLGADDTLLAVTTLSFDIAVLELYLPLTVGGRVVLAAQETATDGAALLETIKRERVTALQATPSTWRLLLSAGWGKTPGLKALVGGEAVPKDLASELLTRCDSVWNMYGPTETTVWSTIWKMTAPLARVLIGRPIGNTQVYILDAKLNPVPVGVPGELHIGGEGVALGYLHRPDLTAERFIDNPFEPGTKLYKTGDLARFLPDGNIEYLRRNDNQVKVRGYRIELGEIESALASHPALEQPVVTVRELSPGDARLVAYALVKPGQSFDEAALRAHLRGRLPDYMVPQHFVRLDRLPLTPNNKVDRKALPAPVLTATSDAEFVPPTGPAEEKLAALWQSVLGVPRVSARANFFHLGGHSLLAAQLISRLNRDHGISLPLRRMFEAPTLAEFAKLFPKENAGDPPPAPLARIPRRTGNGPAPVSLMQQRMWFMEQMLPGSTVYNLPAAFRIRGPLDVAMLERALNTVIARHDSLRTTLLWQDGAPVQVIAPKLELSLEPHDLGTLAVPNRESGLLTRLKALANEPFELATGPLVRARLFRLAADEHVLFFMPHHAIWDGWSFDIFLKEMDALYGAFAEGRPSPLPALPISYPDFAQWQRGWLEGEELERQAAFWRQQLAGEFADLQMPTDRPRPAQMSYQGATEPFTLTADEVAVLTSLGQANSATPYMVLLAAFKALLHRCTGQEDLLVGTPIRGRTQPETEDLIGFFVNALVLRTKVEPGLTFKQLLERVRGVCLDAFSHQDMPFERLLQELQIPRDVSRTPIFQAFFTFQDVRNRESRFGPLAYSQVHVHAEATQTDLSFWVKETNDGIVGGLDYNTDIFDRSTMVRFLRQLRLLLTEVAKDPHREVGRIPILPDSERRLLESWNETHLEFPREKRAITLLEEQAARTPDRIAVESGTTSISYGELDRRADALAAHLRALGVRPGVLVGLCTERSLDMMIGLWGIWKAGGAYVPLDPAFPKERLALMVEDSGMPVLCTQRPLVTDLPDHHAKIVCLDEPLEPLPTAPTADERAPSPEDPAYVIYTSGSTGRPKGVVVPHRAVVNFLVSTAKEPGVGEGDVLLAVTTLSFDIAVLELHLPLSVGAKVVLASRELAGHGARLAETLAKGITIMQATPATWRLLLAAGWPGSPDLKVICGGEALPLDLARALSERVGALYNMYGPTETTVWSTLSHLQRPVNEVLIGKPLANTQLYVLDPLLQRAPVGVRGELHIGGDGVTLGYWQRPDLTSDRFIADPFRPGGTLYKTGDLARFRPDGNVEFIGRNDHQVKVRGFRIELGEIEAALSEHPSVKHAVAAVRELAPGDVRLCAYLVPKDGEDIADSELRKHLRKRLPEYMLPQHFVELAALPLTPNGKIDRKALPLPAGARPTTGSDFVPPRTESEKLLADVWARTLRVDKVSIRDNFFNLGGHSLLSLGVIAEVEKRTGTRLSPRLLLLNSLEQVAVHLPATNAPQAPTPPADEAADSNSSPLLRRMIDKLKRRIQ